MEQKTYITRPSKLYEKIIRLYPPSYLRKHGEELIQDFEDLQRDIGSRKLLWAFIISDFIRSVSHQYMNFIKNHRSAQIALALLALLFILGAWQVITLQKAHSTFDTYAAFRGCAQITSESDTQGTCITSSGASITIVKFDNKWYLQNDLPICMISIGSFCLVDQP